MTPRVRASRAHAQPQDLDQRLRGGGGGEADCLVAATRSGRYREARARGERGENGGLKGRADLRVILGGARAASSFFLRPAALKNFPLLGQVAHLEAVGRARAMCVMGLKLVGAREISSGGRHHARPASARVRASRRLPRVRALGRRGGLGGGAGAGCSSGARRCTAAAGARQLRLARAALLEQARARAVGPLRTRARDISTSGAPPYSVGAVLLACSPPPPRIITSILILLLLMLPPLSAAAASEATPRYYYYDASLETPGRLLLDLRGGRRLLERRGRTPASRVPALSVSARAARGQERQCLAADFSTGYRRTCPRSTASRRRPIFTPDGAMPADGRHARAGGRAVQRRSKPRQAAPRARARKYGIVNRCDGE